MRKLSVNEMKTIKGGHQANSCYTICRDEFGVDYVEGFSCPNGFGDWISCQNKYGPLTCAQCSPTCGSTLWVC